MARRSRVAKRFLVVEDTQGAVVHTEPGSRGEGRCPSAALCIVNDQRGNGLGSSSG